MNTGFGLFWLGVFILFSAVVIADRMPEPAGKWSKYQPRPGVECAAFFIEHKHDVDCYPVPKEKKP